MPCGYMYIKPENLQILYYNSAARGYLKPLNTMPYQYMSETPKKGNGMYDEGPLIWLSSDPKRLIC